MKSKFTYVIAGMLLLLAGAAWAQPCVPSPDPNSNIVIPVGTSQCFQVCPGTYYNIILEGNLVGPGAVPVLIMQAGCVTGYCNVTCTPINPPGSLVFGGDPFYPDFWYGATDCVIIYLHWVHDNIWAFEIFSFCEGCFCVTFDHQLSVQLASLTALPGDNEVTLNWATASETDNDHFEIERDGVKLDDVPATNNAGGSTYSYTDNTAVNGQEYNYRLLSVDMTGNPQVLGSVKATPTNSAATVTRYALHQNYPNPFNPETSIEFDLVDPGMTRLAIYNVLGQSVATLVNGTLQAGRHTVVFNGANLPSGLYIYKLQVNGFSDVKKLVLLK